MWTWMCMCFCVCVYPPQSQSIHFLDPPLKLPANNSNNSYKYHIIHLLTLPQMCDAMAKLCDDVMCEVVDYTS